MRIKLSHIVKTAVFALLVFFTAGVIFDHIGKTRDDAFYTCNTAALNDMVQSAASSQYIDSARNQSTMLDALVDRCMDAQGYRFIYDTRVQACQDGRGPQCYRNNWAP